MIRTILAAGAAIGVGLGGAALAHSLRMAPIPQAVGTLLVDDDHDKHRHGKNRHREEEDENDDEGHGRGRRSWAPGAGRGYPGMPGYYYPPPASAYATPYAPYAPAAPPSLAPPPARVGAQPAAPPTASTEPGRGAGSSPPSVQWVDPPPAR
jgi:hypothetical protein